MFLRNQPLGYRKHTFAARGYAFGVSIQRRLSQDLILVNEATDENGSLRLALIRVTLDYQIHNLSVLRTTQQAFRQGLPQ